MITNVKVKSSSFAVPNMFIRSIVAYLTEFTILQSLDDKSFGGAQSSPSKILSYACINCKRMCGDIDHNGFFRTPIRGGLINMPDI